MNTEEEGSEGGRDVRRRVRGRGKGIVERGEATQ